MLILPIPCCAIRNTFNVSLNSIINWSLVFVIVRVINCLYVSSRTPVFWRCFINLSLQPSNHLLVMLISSFYMILWRILTFNFSFSIIVFLGCQIPLSSLNFWASWSCSAISTWCPSIIIVSNPDSWNFTFLSIYSSSIQKHATFLLLLIQLANC